MNRTLFILLLTGFLSFAGYSQTDSTYVDDDEFYPSVFNGSDNKFEVSDNVDHPEKSNYTLSSGFSMMNLGGQNYFNSWILPSYNFNLSPKLKVDLGVMIQRTNFPRSFYPVDEYENKPMQTRAYVVSSGTYQAGSKLIITGSYIGEIPQNNYNQQIENFQNNYQQIRMGLHYQIAPNIHFQANFMYDNADRFNQFGTPYQGRGGYYSSPFGY